VPATPAWVPPTPEAEATVDAWGQAATPDAGSGDPSGDPSSPWAHAQPSDVEWVGGAAPLPGGDDASVAPTWVAPPVELPVEPILEVDPSPIAAPPAVHHADPLDLDPGRVEFIGYVDPAAAAAPATGDAVASRPFVPPSGSIVDVGRRPPGARPVAPTTRPAAGSATASTAGAVTATPAASTPVTSTPGATGGDLWDLVTAPATTSAAPAPKAKGSSRLATLMLTLAVVLVILAIVAGFLYMFTDRL